MSNSPTTPRVGVVLWALASYLLLGAQCWGQEIVVIVTDLDGKSIRVNPQGEPEVGMFVYQLSPTNDVTVLPNDIEPGKFSGGVPNSLRKIDPTLASSGLVARSDVASSAGRPSIKKDVVNESDVEFDRFTLSNVTGTLMLVFTRGPNRGPSSNTATAVVPFVRLDSGSGTQLIRVSVPQSARPAPIMDPTPTCAAPAPRYVYPHYNWYYNPYQWGYSQGWHCRNYDD